MRFSPPRGLVRMVLAIVVTPSLSLADSPAKTVESSYGCGVLALYYLLRLEDRPVNLRHVDANLPIRGDHGHSLGDLRNAARRCGLELTGVYLRKSNILDRPAMVFLKSGDHGHFVVVRPVGNKGKMVQILDSISEPEVLDASDLYNTPEWTGLALIPARPNWTLRVGIGLAITILCMLILRLTFRHSYLDRALATWRPGRLQSG